MCVGVLVDCKVESGSEEWRVENGKEDEGKEVEAEGGSRWR